MTEFVSLFGFSKVDSQLRSCALMGLRGSDPLQERARKKTTCGTFSNGVVAK